MAHAWEWQLQGSCRETDAALFFHPERERGPSRRRRDAAAKAVCRRCPVVQQCRAHALATPEAYGVWGGLTEEERAMVAARSGRHHVPRVDRGHRPVLAPARGSMDADGGELSAAERPIPA